MESFFTEEELNPGKDAINDLVDELAHKLYNGGKIKSRLIFILSILYCRLFLPLLHGVSENIPTLER